MSDARKALEKTQTETNCVEYIKGRFEPSLFTTDDGMTAQAWYYQDPVVTKIPITQQVPDVSAVVTGLTLADGRTLAEAVKLTCPHLPKGPGALLPLCAQYEYIKFSAENKSDPVLTLFGYISGNRDDNGILLPDTVLTLEGIEPVGDWKQDAILKLAKKAERKGLSVSLAQIAYNEVKGAIRSTTRTVTTWYKDDKTARNTQAMTEALYKGEQPGTNKLRQTARLAVGDGEAVLLQHIVSVRTGRVLRESQQDGQGKPTSFICHAYDSRGRGLSSTTYEFDQAAFDSGDVSKLNVKHTQTVGYQQTVAGTQVRLSDATGRHSRVLYDGLQRVVRRELQREPGNDHTDANYCLLEEVCWGSDSRLNWQEAYDYLPGGLRVGSPQVTPPQNLKDCYWQIDRTGKDVTDNATGAVSRKTQSVLGLYAGAAQFTHEHEQTNLKDGSVTLARASWTGGEKTTRGAGIKTVETLNAKGQVTCVKQTIPCASGSPKQREWEIAWDELARKESIKRPDGSVVKWEYQGLSSVPVKVSVTAAQGSEKVLGSRSMVGNGNQGDVVQAFVRGADASKKSTLNAGKVRQPDGSAVYPKELNGDAVCWYTQKAGETGLGTALITFKYSALTRGIAGERKALGTQQSQVTSQLLSPLLLGTWRFDRTVHRTLQRQQALRSLRGQLISVRHASGGSSEAWSNLQGRRSRVRRGSLEYRYQYTALGQCASVMVQDMRNGQRMSVAFSYDALGRESERIYRVGGQVKARYHQTWSAANQLLSKTLYRDGAAEHARIETFTYNTTVTGTDELQKWTVVATDGNEVKDAAGKTINEQIYTYDVLGNMSSCTTLRADGSTVEQSYEYTDAQHPTRRTQFKSHKLEGTTKSEQKLVALAYDGNGNLTTNEHEQTLAYSETGKLRSVTAKGQTLPLTYYEYDEADQLIAQYIAATQQRRILSYANGRVCAETWLDTQGTVIKRVTLDDEAGFAIALGDQVLFTLTDPQNGGGDEYSQDAHGNWQRNSVSFTPWGEAPLDSMNALKAGLGYNGQRADPVTGRYHLGNGYRVYDPGHKVFYQPDDWSPFGAGGLNDRAYCAEGDPVNWHDPSGHIMISRRDAASNLAYLDDLIEATKPPPPQAASVGEWVMLGVMVAISAAAIIGSAGLLAPAVVGILMVGLAVGAGITATGMALRQSNPSLSATLEPIGHVVMTLASAPAVGAQMLGVAKWMMYASTFAYAGFEIAKVAVQRSNPELAEKLGWAATIASFADIVGVKALKGLKAAFKIVRNVRARVVKAFGKFRMSRFSRSTEYLDGNALRGGDPSFVTFKLGSEDPEYQKMMNAMMQPKRNAAGGMVWMTPMTTNSGVTEHTIHRIIAGSEGSRPRITILTGTHGNPYGQRQYKFMPDHNGVLQPNPMADKYKTQEMPEFFAADLEVAHKYKDYADFEVLNVAMYTRIEGIGPYRPMMEREMAPILNGPNHTIAAFCHSAVDTMVTNTVGGFVNYRQVRSLPREKVESMAAAGVLLDQSAVLPNFFNDLTRYSPDPGVWSPSRPPSTLPFGNDWQAL